MRTVIRPDEHGDVPATWLGPSYPIAPEIAVLHVGNPVAVRALLYDPAGLVGVWSTDDRWFPGRAVLDVEAGLAPDEDDWRDEIAGPFSVWPTPHTPWCGRRHEDLALCPPEPIDQAEAARRAQDTWADPDNPREWLPEAGSDDRVFDGPELSGDELLVRLRDLLRRLHDGGVIPPGADMEEAGFLLNRLEDLTGDPTDPADYPGAPR